MATAPQGRLGPARVQFADPAAPKRYRASMADFLKECRAASRARFRMPAGSAPPLRAIQHPVPPKMGDLESTGTIIAYLSPGLCTAWEALGHGTRSQRRAFLTAEMHLALEDLAEQDIHGYLAITRQQRAVYKPDFVQLVDEALDRTSFARLARRPDPHWQGTFVQRVHPPFLLLALSIGFAGRPGLHRRVSVPGRGRR